MRTLINDLLAYSRVSRQQDSSEQLDLNKTIQDILLDLEPVLNESRAVVTKELLPTITGNSFEMQQLFQNLLTNAIKFHGSDQPKVHISCQKNEKEWLIGVHDNGIGIDKKYHDQIFKVFQRLHGRDSYPGTGIGLAICKKIVEQHGGKIWVTSQVNSGSHFYFTWLLNQPAPKHELNPV